jgi:predicted ATPase
MALQFEPSSLRRPDDFGAEPSISPRGEHIPATLSRLGSPPDIASQLSELIPDVREVYVDSDEGRRLRTLKVVDREGVTHSARSLSDGTLRFLALATMRYDPDMTGLMCFEEPENGIHPSRVGAMLRLLEGIAVNPQEPLDENNALRQVIINTHSPVVVQSLPLDTLIFARNIKSRLGSEMAFECLPGTWRADTEPKMRSAPMGELLPYLTGGGLRAKEDAGSYRESVLAFAAKQAEFDYIFHES